MHGRFGVMIALQIQTSSSELIPISDFRYIYELARCSKCQMFILLKSTNKLYGASDECCCIHEISIPFQVNTDLMFKIGCIPKGFMDKYGEDSFFVPDNFNWTILPSYYFEMYKSGDIYSEYSFEELRYILKDKCTKQPIDQIPMSDLRMNVDFAFQTMMVQLEGFLNRTRYLTNPIQFTGLQDHPIIRKVYDNKTSAGSSIVPLEYNGDKIVLSFYKGMFSLNKGDSLDLDIRFDSMNRNLFMATFKPLKKKNPMSAFKMYNYHYNEVIHCMFRNLP